MYFYRRVLPQSGPPPPPPNEEAATTPIRRPPPPKRQESAPAARSTGALLLDNDQDGVQLRKNVKNKSKREFFVHYYFAICSSAVPVLLAN